MAAYKDLYGIWYESSLMNRVTVAVVVAAQAIQDEDPATDNHANRLIWAQRAFEYPSTVAATMFRVILAVNKDATCDVILAAPDASIQSAVNDAVDTFATGG